MLTHLSKDKEAVPVRVKVQAVLNSIPGKIQRSLPGLTEEGYRLKQYLNNSKVWFAEGSFDNVKDEDTTSQLHRQAGTVIQAHHFPPTKHPKVSPSYLHLSQEHCPG